MRYSLIIFDLDGTLADSFPFFLRVHDELARRHGFRSVDGEDIDALRRLTTREMLARSGLPAWRLPRVARDFVAAMKQADDVRPFPGVPALLPALAAHATLALVTSNAREVAAQVLGPEAMALFAQVDCGASIFGKARRLRRLLATTGIAAADAIYIGDQVADADAARDAGIAFGAVDWGYAAPETLAACAPAHRFRTVEEIGALVSAASGGRTTATSR